MRRNGEFMKTKSYVTTLLKFALAFTFAFILLILANVNVEAKTATVTNLKETDIEPYENPDITCSRSKFLSKLLKTFDKTFREIFPVFISTKRREKPSAFFDNNFVNNAYFSEAASSSSSHLASSSSKAPISSRMTCLCLWSS